MPSLNDRIADGVEGVQDVGLRARHWHNGEKDSYLQLYCMGRLFCSPDERIALALFPSKDVRDHQNLPPQQNSPYSHVVIRRGLMTRLTCIE